MSDLVDTLVRKKKSYTKRNLLKYTKNYFDLLSKNLQII